MSKQNVLTRSKKKKAIELYRHNLLAEAKTLCQQVSQVDQMDGDVWAMLSAINGRLGLLDEAELCGTRAATLQPGNFDAHYNLGCAQLALDKMECAIASFRSCLAIRPDHAKAYVGLGNAYAFLGSLQQAVDAYEKVLATTPNAAGVHSNLGNVLADQGRIDEAVEHWQYALTLNPNSPGIHSNLLLSLNYQLKDPEWIFQEHLKWAEKYASSAVELTRRPIAPDPERQIRVAYVTPDLRNHSVAYFIEPILANHSRTRFKIFCYMETASPDETTRRLLGMVDHWRSTGRLSDEEFARMIQDDEIDILVDLAGHTAHNRLPVFARKPAPLQITYLGYPNTTGMAAMDYRITDAWADPLGQTEHLHAETLLRLPLGFLCFLAPAESPPINPLPALTAGYVTFGSFNYIAKITPATLALWAKVLRGVPESRLILKNKSFSDIATRERHYKMLAGQGILADRVELIGLTPSKAEHMAVYGRVDIALDTYPYNGTTTTCDTLWMGVPVVTLAGGTHVSRVGVSLLSQVGLSELIAHSEQEYVDIAINLATNIKHLSGLRIGLRDRMANAPLCDGKSITDTLEQQYREVWQAWCAEQTKGSARP